MVLFHPDYTVGPGVTPDLLTQVAKNHMALAGYTAGGELHPALRTSLFSIECDRGQGAILRQKGGQISM